MSEQVYWVLEVEINEGQLGRFKELMAVMVESTGKESGTLTYEWTLGEDGKTCHTLERYADSTAVMTHLGTFGAQFAGKFMELARPTRFVVHGTPNAAVREALKGYSPQYMAPLGGFSR